ncbi:MAG: hypothetical protein SGJ05_04915 [bacterium]|nr:hypothetical protein [bacterium]
MRYLVVLICLFILTGSEPMPATPVEVLTMSVTPTVVNEDFTIKIYNAYTMLGGIRRGLIAGLQGNVIEDLTSNILQSNHGVQEISRSLPYQARGVYFIVLETQIETITIKIVKMW